MPCETTFHPPGQGSARGNCSAGSSPAASREGRAGPDGKAAKGGRRSKLPPSRSRKDQAQSDPRWQPMRSVVLSPFHPASNILRGLPRVRGTGGMTEGSETPPGTRRGGTSAKSRSPLQGWQGDHMRPARLPWDRAPNPHDQGIGWLGVRRKGLNSRLSLRSGHRRAPPVGRETALPPLSASPPSPPPWRGSRVRPSRPDRCPSGSCPPRPANPRSARNGG